jgi:hypothetical protein
MTPRDLWFLLCGGLTVADCIVAGVVLVALGVKI